MLLQFRVQLLRKTGGSVYPLEEMHNFLCISASGTANFSVQKSSSNDPGPCAVLNMLKVDLYIVENHFARDMHISFIHIPEEAN